MTIRSRLGASARGTPRVPPPGSGGGSQGAQGAQGRQGSQGAQGTQGAGFQGAQGAQGRQGFQGAVGTTGAQGAQGATGSQGFQGAQGPQGFQGGGFQGAQGFQGFQGATGAQGSQGAQGTQGATARPLTAEVWVDQNAVAGGNGSIVTPFTTITAGIAALPTGGGAIYLTAGTYPETLTFPAGNFYLVADPGVDFPGIAILSGAISAPNTGVLYLESCQIASTCVLTGVLYLVLASSAIASTGSVTNPSGAPAKLIAYSPAFSRANTYSSVVISGPITVRGIVALQNSRVDADISCASFQASSTEFANAHTLTTSNATSLDSVQLRNCCLGLVGWTYTGVATHSFRCEDDASALTVGQAGLTLTNATVFVLGTYNRQDETTTAGGATATIDWKLAASASAGPRVQLLQLTAGATPCVLTFVDPLFDGELTLSIIQSPGGPYTVTWPASVHWPGGVAPTLTVTNGHRDSFLLRKQGAVYYGSTIGLDYA